MQQKKSPYKISHCCDSTRSHPLRGESENERPRTLLIRTVSMILEVLKHTVLKHAKTLENQNCIKPAMYIDGECCLCNSYKFCYSHIYFGVLFSSMAELFSRG